MVFLMIVFFWFLMFNIEFIVIMLLIYIILFIVLLIDCNVRINVVEILVIFVVDNCILLNVKFEMVFEFEKNVFIVFKYDVKIV